MANSTVVHGNGDNQMKKKYQFTTQSTLIWLTLLYAQAIHATPHYTALWGSNANNEIFYSPDGGLTWTNNTNLKSNWQKITGLSEKPDVGARLAILTSGVHMSDKNNKKIFIPKIFGTQNVQNIYASSDMGATYNRLNGGLRVLALSPDGTLYGFNNGSVLYKSADEGNTWQNIFNGKHYVMGITIAPDDGTIYYISSHRDDATQTRPNQLIRSDNTGTAWQPVGNIDICSTKSTYHEKNGTACVILSRIAAGSGGVIWGIDKDNRVFQFTDKGTKGTEPYPDLRLTYVTVALNGDVYGIAPDGSIKYLQMGTSEWQALAPTIKLATIHAAPWWPANVAQDQEKCADWCKAVASIKLQGELSQRACKNACINSAQFNDSIAKIMLKYAPQNAPERLKILSDCSAELNDVKNILDDSLFDIAEGLVSLKSMQHDKQKVIATMERVKKAGEKTITALERSLTKCKEG